MYELINNADQRATMCRVYFCKMQIHIGKMIDLVRTQRGMTKSELARRINKHRSTLEDIILRSSVDTELLYIIGKVLEHDFFSDLSKTYTDAFSNGDLPLEVAIINEVENESELPVIQDIGELKWKDKYYELLEKYASTLEENKRTAIDMPELSTT